ncbi:MAG TPA: hypothetical protein VF516_39105 [Kofleriaceae bacterium]
MSLLRRPIEHELHQHHFPNRGAPPSPGLVKTPSTDTMWFENAHHDHRHEHPGPFPYGLVQKPSPETVTHTFRHLVRLDGKNNTLPAPAEVIVRTRVERTAGEYVLGDLVYTLSLLPGEEVQVYTSDRRTSFKLDTQTNVAWQASASFEDQMYLSAMDRYFAQLSANEWAQATSSTSGSFNASAETSSALESFFGGGDADMEGSFNVNSVATFLGGMAAQASAAHESSATATNTASALTVGAVGTRTGVQGKIDTHVEMNYRSFRNPSRTRAVTFYFFQIRRRHKVRVTVDKLEVAAPERTLWRMALADAKQTVKAAPLMMPVLGTKHIANIADYQAARETIVNEMVAKKLLEQKDGQLVVPEALRTQTTFEREFTLCTPGIYVMGDRDRTTIADPSLLRDAWTVGAAIADEVEALAISAVERAGNTIVPAVAGVVRGAQAMLAGASSLLP